MQRRLSEYLKELEENIQAIKDKYAQGSFNSIDDIREYFYSISGILIKLLNAPCKSFEVTFKGEVCNFFYPSTLEEKEYMDLYKTLFVGKLLACCIDEMRNGNDTWWMVTAFASGIDTLDMQIEIVKEDVVNRVDGQGEKITALPLDMGNYQVKLEMEYDKPDQTLDL